MFAIRRCAASDGMPLASAWGRRFLASGSWFSNVELAPKDPILGVTEAFMVSAITGFVQYALLTEWYRSTYVADHRIPRAGG